MTRNSRSIAVAGCGHWGKNLVWNLAELSALRTIYDSDPGKMASLKSRFPDINLADSFSEVLKDDKVTAVVIAAPAVSHYTLAKEALPIIHFKISLPISQ